jgi:hypothetical protein
LRSRRTSLAAAHSPANYDGHAHILGSNTPDQRHDLGIAHPAAAGLLVQRWPPWSHGVLFKIFWRLALCSSIRAERS